MDIADPRFAERLRSQSTDSTPESFPYPGIPATCDGAEGWGLFEHATIGRHDPSGFTDLGSVAP